MWWLYKFFCFNILCHKTVVPVSQQLRIKVIIAGNREPAHLLFLSPVSIPPLSILSSGTALRANSTVMPAKESRSGNYLQFCSST
jgi:hypothetical protein